MRFSRAIDRMAVDTSSAWGVHNRASTLKESGEDIILFSIGDPDLPTLDITVDRCYEPQSRAHTLFAGRG